VCCAVFIGTHWHHCCYFNWCDHAIRLIAVNIASVCMFWYILLWVVFLDTALYRLWNYDLWRDRNMSIIIIIINIRYAYVTDIAWCLIRYLKSTLGNIRLICMVRKDESQVEISREKKVTYWQALFKSTRLLPPVCVLYFICFKNIVSAASYLFSFDARVQVGLLFFVIIFVLPWAMHYYCHHHC